MKSKIIAIAGFLFLLIVSWLIVGFYLQKQLVRTYEDWESPSVLDRNGQKISISQNPKGYWSRYLDSVPPEFKKLLLRKEDRYFYYHFGFNPWSIFQTALSYLGFGQRAGSSTISQQLVKILLEKELERNFKNKILESFYVLGLETYKTKEDILKMYVNSAYFGNQAQGLKEASFLYFNVSPDMLTQGQIIQLLATVHNPSENNPLKEGNREIAASLAEKLKANENLAFASKAEVLKNTQNYNHLSKSFFEINSLFPDLHEGSTTIDEEMNQKIRSILKRNVEELSPKNVQNGAVVVIKLPENELLAMVGSPDPWEKNEGYKINMLKEPRPIGSTIKPFLYLKAFEKGLRPYTLVDDREYKYITALGFPLYPKNFDFQYRGEVSLHYSLSNSLNVPAVKTLEYLGLDNFYSFLEKDLGFTPLQSWNNYQLGIALGSLEMNLLDLAKYFTIFPNKGVLKDVKISPNQETNPEKKIAEEKFIQLVNKILNDRKTGAEQFGLVSDLNLFQNNYALKTGTSRDFKDSWILGYTPDFLVGVWLGNADNSSMDEISGQKGAGRIWAEVMELILNSSYNKKAPFNFDQLKEFQGDNLEYGLPTDDYQIAKNILKNEDTALILSPHQSDTFLLEKNTQIFLEAKEKVSWEINGRFQNTSEKEIFSPQEQGIYQISAKSSSGQTETISIYVTREN